MFNYNCYKMKLPFLITIYFILLVLSYHMISSLYSSISLIIDSLIKNSTCVRKHDTLIQWVTLVLLVLKYLKFTVGKHSGLGTKFAPITAWGSFPLSNESIAELGWLIEELLGIALRRETWKNECISWGRSESRFLKR